mmetsp:Transcript_114241/g.369101  ORF Transcript_114241/g.369101 Transcript_114241/m.369101 type:complete len:219 (+) Transcript_114241:555-1211(+)
MWARLKAPTISPMTVASLVSVMETTVQEPCSSLLMQISAAPCTSMAPTSKTRSPSPPSAADCNCLLALRRVACSRLWQYCTASWTVGKNHCSPMYSLSFARLIVFSTRLPTMQKAVWMLRLRQSCTMSCSTWTAVESMVTTGVISRMTYLVLLTSSRSLTYVRIMSLMYAAFAKYIEEPMRQMKTFWTKLPLPSCFMLRYIVVPGMRQRMEICGRADW